MSEKDPFKIEKEGHITWLIFDRPEKRNTMDYAFFDGLKEHFTEFDEDPEVRVIIIKGEGKCFTGGIDLPAMESMVQGDGVDVRENIRKNLKRFQEAMNAVETCHKPVIAAAHSHCIGGGVDLLSACDVRTATRDTLFSIRETRLAEVAALGTLQRLPYIIGHGWFRELALTGRDFSAEEALKIGFITHLCEDRDALYQLVRELAADIAALSPLAVQGVKEVVLFSRDRGIYPGLEYVAQKNAALMPSEDIREAILAFKEKRAPVYKGK